MSRKLKKVVSIIVLVLILAVIWIIKLDFAVSKEQAQATAEEFFTAINYGDTAKAESLFHPWYSLSNSKTEPQKSDSFVFTQYIQGPYATFFPNVNRSFSNCLLARVQSGQHTYLVCFTFKKNIMGYGISYYSCTQMDSDDTIIP